MKPTIRTATTCAACGAAAGILAPVTFAPGADVFTTAPALAAAGAAAGIAWRGIRWIYSK